MTCEKFGPKSFVKIGPVLADMLLIWTSDTRAYIVWTNVTMTVVSFKHGPKILSLKSGQNWVSNIRDISDMDKCHQNKCCLDKRHNNSWLTESGQYSESVYSVLECLEVAEQFVVLGWCWSRPVLGSALVKLDNYFHE